MRVPRLRRSAAAAAAVIASVVASVSLAAPPRASAAGAGFGGTAADGAHVVAEQQVDSRTLDVTISSPAVAAETTVRLLLPPGWSPSASRTWPVLYLLHGCCDTDQTWTQQTNVEQATQGAPVIIAMPDGGPVGFYSNWWNFGLGGENWETYTATELPQILQSGFRASAVKGIGGVSTGGGAALFIAAHHPGGYAVAASYSGMDCTELPQAVTTVFAAIVRAGILPDDLWGDPVRQLPIWQDHNPCALASSLRGTRLFLSVGSGLTVSGSQTSCSAGLTSNILESVVATGVYTFAATLSALGIPYTSDFYGGGCHAWPDWSTTFDQSWPMLEAALGA
jgi:diacylglycerol O-acyltransferase / trehalose O-mycolyltransferase